MVHRIRESDARSSALLRALGATLVLAWLLDGTSACAANGDVDPTFGSGGLALAGIGNPESFLVGSGDPTSLGVVGPVIQTDGKILICDQRDAGDPTGNDIFVARFDAGGVLDPDFGTDGVATIDFANGSDSCGAMALQADGRIVVAGQTQGAASADFAVARLTDAGLPDPEFGSGTGKVTLAFDSAVNRATGVAIQADQMIVVSGYAQTASHGSDFAVARLLTDGSPDATFNSTGKQTLGFDLAVNTSQDDQALALALDAQGRILLAGDARSGPDGDKGLDFAVARLLGNGQPDMDFGADGRATVAFDIGISANEAATALVLQPDGRIVLAGVADTAPSGTANFDMAVARLLPTGAPDPDFGTSGKTTVAFDLIDYGTDQAFGVAVQGNGKLLLVGYAQYKVVQQAGLAATLRLNRDGGLDPDFGVLGRKTYDFGLTSPSSQYLGGATFTSAGIVACGTALVSASLSDDFVVRLGDDLIFANEFE